MHVNAIFAALRDLIITTWSAASSIVSKISAGTAVVLIPPKPLPFTLHYLIRLDLPFRLSWDERLWQYGCLHGT